ncbi:hypothetical protein AO398_02195 [Methylobacterium sp. GXS13]|nr:hypothetical protein AO398_02195 [Methylobacterium sp. GXS13]
MAKAEEDRCYSNGIQCKVGADGAKEAANPILSSSFATKQSSNTVLGRADRRSQPGDAEESSQRAIPRFIDDDRVGIT